MPDDVKIEHENVLTANVRQARIARVYAEALIAVAARAGQAEAVGDELEAFVADVLGKDPRVAAFLASPVITRRTREPVLAAALANAPELLAKFLRVLNQNSRLDLLKPIAAAYRDLLDQRSGKVRVTVRSAAPLSPDQEQELRRTLAESLRKEPILQLHTDPELLGGLVVQVGDKVYDSSVRTRLAALRSQLTARGTNVVKA